MRIFAGLCLLGSCAAGLSLGLRLLWVWRRTRMLPEMSIGVTSLSISLSGALLLYTAQTPREQFDHLLQAMYLASLFFLALSSVALGFGFWQIFRPAETWPGWLCGAGSAALLAWWVLCAGQGGSGLTGEGGLRPAFFFLGRMLIHPWGVVECFGYYLLLKRRAALGLADPLIAHQFWLWGVSGLALLATIGLPFYAAYVIRSNVMTWPAGLLGLSASGLVSAVAMWWAFFPPRCYRRWIRARAPERSPA